MSFSIWQKIVYFYLKWKQNAYMASIFLKFFSCMDGGMEDRKRTNHIKNCRQSWKFHHYYSQTSPPPPAKKKKHQENGDKINYIRLWQSLKSKCSYVYIYFTSFWLGQIQWDPMIQFVLMNHDSICCGLLNSLKSIFI